MTKPQFVDDDLPPLHQPDIFERSVATAVELLALIDNMHEAALRFEAARSERLFGGMRSAVIDLQNYRVQYVAMVASIERIIEAESGRGK